MPEYSYVARDRAGKSASGVIQASDDGHLLQILRANDLYVTEFRSASREKEGEAKPSPLSWSGGPKLQDLVIATRQIASMLRAGVPLVSALEIVESQTRKPALTAAFEDIRRAVTEGQRLSEAMRRHPKVFTPLVVALVTAGEISGELDVALDVAADQLDREAVLRKKLKTASAYPKLVLLASCGTIGAMLTFVVPVFAGVYKQLHATLPATTLLLMAVSDFAVHRGWLLLLAAGGGYLAYRKTRQTDSGRMWTDRMWLNTPIFGPVLRKLVIARFVHTLAGGLRGGVPVISALEVASATSGNAVMEAAVHAAAENVRDGASLSTELERSGEFPTMVTRMIAAGEASGNVDAALDEINRFYDRDVNQAMETLTRLLEPAMTIVLGSVVLVVLLALYMPIFEIGKAVSNYK